MNLGLREEILMKKASLYLGIAICLLNGYFSNGFLSLLLSIIGIALVMHGADEF